MCVKIWMQGLLIKSFEPFCIHFFTFIHSKKNPQGSDTQDTAGGGLREGGLFVSSLVSPSIIIACSKFLFDPFIGLNHVLVSDMDVSSIISLSCMSHSKRKRWKASFCLSALKDCVSRHTFTSSTGWALLSLPSAEVLSIFISAGVLRVFLTLSLISVPAKQHN